ncbi:MAG TPA: hypothetical protein VGC36_10715, partial [Rhizomicrobium sp.]
LVVRAGDFFGPSAANSWFSQGMVKPGAPLTAITAPGPLDVGHDWAYLPDLAETMVRLVEREDRLAPFDKFHLGGHWFARGGELVDSIRRVVGKSVPLRLLPWWALRALSPVVPLFREMAEMRYLWQQPLRLDNAKLLAVLGSEPHTPVDDAVRATLIGLGCLPA